MAAYLLDPDGERGPPLPFLKGSITRAQLAEKRKAKSSKGPRKVLPLVAQGSALATVYPEANKPAGTGVFIDEYNLAWHSVLNAVDLADGTNKYYKMQLLQTGSSYCVYRAWGRVGGGGAGGKSGGGKSKSVPGYLNSDVVHEHGVDLDGAKKEFREQFKKLAKCEFEWCEPPVQHPSGYAVTLLPGQLSDEATGEAAAGGGGRSASGSAMGSSLPPPVARFVSLIGDKKMMAAQLQEIHVDLEKMPLGSISTAQIKRGYEALTRVATQLQTPAADGDEQKHRLLTLTTHFYTTIPHKFGLDEVPPVIDSLPMLKDKLDMVEALLQVQESQKLSKSLGPAAEQHPLDAMYAQLQCGLAPASEAEHEMVRRYAANTHGSTHDTYKINVKDVLAVSRAAEQPGFKASLANRQLLWHGSRLTNWAGILSQGLRIAPPEAPVTGYMFGKGVYFADMSSKSANYCGATSANPTAVLLLCDVALGSQYERLNAEYEAAESCKKAGKASTWGVGKFAPADGGASSIEGGAIRVPMGEAGDSEYMKANFARLQKAEGGKARAALLYNEYIVYDVSQIQMKYVVVCELEFDG